MTIEGGNLSINQDPNLGKVPSSLDSASVVIAGGTLLATGSFPLAATRGIELGGTVGTSDFTSGEIDVATGQTLAYAGPIIDGSSGNQLIVGDAAGQNTGTLVLSGPNTYSGGTFIQSGATLSVSRDSYLGKAPKIPTAGNIALNGGTLEATAGFILNSNRGVALGPPSGSGFGTIEVAGGNTLSFGGIVANNGSGSGGLTLTGGGTLVLSGANTYNGGTTISTGTLEFRQRRQSRQRRGHRQFQPCL